VKFRLPKAKAHLPQLLDDVERGETLVITRHGRAIARIMPEVDRRQEEVNKAIASKELLSARDEGESPVGVCAGPSIVACWAFPDEQELRTEAALTRVRTEEAIVPRLWWFEVRNILVVNERRKRITESGARSSFVRL